MEIANVALTKVVANMVRNKATSRVTKQEMIRKTTL